MLSKNYSPLALTTYSSFIAALISLPFFIQGLNNGLMPKGCPMETGIISLLGLIFFNSIGCFFLYQWGNKHSSAFTAASVVYVSPLTAAIIAIPLLGEKITVSLAVGATFIFLSLFLTSLYPLLFKNKKHK